MLALPLAVYTIVLRSSVAALAVLGIVLLAAALLRPAAGLVPWALASLEDRAAARFRVAGLLVMALAAATIGTLLVAAGAAVPAGAEAVQVVGALGAVGALLTLALLARRS